MLLKKRSIIVMLALLIVLPLIFSACSGSKGNNASQEDSKVLRVGIDDTYPPMEYKDKDGNNVGFDIDLAKALGEKLGMKVEFVSTAWSAIFSALEADKYDCIISSLSITEERKKNIAYTRPYIANNQVIIVKSDNTTINSEKDLEGKIVAVQMGTTSDDACTEFNKVTPFKDFKKYEAMTEALNELKIGRVDAVVTDLVVGKYFVARDEKSYKLVDTTLPKEPIGIGCKKGNEELANKLDKALEELMKDGTLKKISEEWFGEDLTSNIE